METFVIVKLLIILEKLSLTTKQTPKKKNKEEKEFSNVVEKRKKNVKKEQHKETAEDRANKELEKIAAYQARIAKQKSKAKKIRTVVDKGGQSANNKGIYIYKT